jgi:hypothetical protein
VSYQVFEQEALPSGEVPLVEDGANCAPLVDGKLGRVQTATGSSLCAERGKDRYYHWRAWLFQKWMSAVGGLFWAAESETRFPL